MLQKMFYTFIDVFFFPRRINKELYYKVLCQLTANKDLNSMNNVSSAL